MAGFPVLQFTLPRQPVQNPRRALRSLVADRDLQTKKKSSEQKALRITPWFIWSFSSSSDIARTDSPTPPQAGFLAHGSAYSPHLPIAFSRQQWPQRISSPFTEAGPLPNFTGFPIKLLVPDGSTTMSLSRIQVVADAVKSKETPMRRNHYRPLAYRQLMNAGTRSISGAHASRVIRNGFPSRGRKKVATPIRTRGTDHMMNSLPP